MNGQQQLLSSHHALGWGSGNKDNNIQSGQGFVHNAFLFESPLKGIVETKFDFLDL